MDKKILIGMHDPSVADTFVALCECLGYAPEVVHDKKTMLERSGGYDAYLMDPNLGYPNSTDINPCVEIYEAIKPKLDNEQTKLIAISGNPDTVSAVREFAGGKKGIFALEKPFSLDKLSGVLQ